MNKLLKIPGSGSGFEENSQDVSRSENIAGATSYLRIVSVILRAASCSSDAVCHMKQSCRVLVRGEVSCIHVFSTRREGFDN
jgi:hypothetical protein